MLKIPEAILRKSVFDADVSEWFGNIVSKPLEEIVSAVNSIADGLPIKRILVQKINILFRRSLPKPIPLPPETVYSVPAELVVAEAIPQPLREVVPVQVVHLNGNGSHNGTNGTNGNGASHGHSIVAVREPLSVRSGLSPRVPKNKRGGKKLKFKDKIRTLPQSETSMSRGSPLSKAELKALKRKTEEELWTVFKSDPSENNRNKIWVYYQSLVRYISERLKTRLPNCVDVNDLIGAGNIGLLDAINKFDLEYQVRFQTYCVPRIRGAILDSIRSSDWVPRLIRHKAHMYSKAVEELAVSLHREPTDDEIREKLQMSPEDLELLQQELKVKSQVSVEGTSKKNADERDPVSIEMFQARHVNKEILSFEVEDAAEAVMRGLNDDEREFVRMYYFENLSMKEIGVILNLSESRICQINRQALEFMGSNARRLGLDAESIFGAKPE